MLHLKVMLQAANINSGMTQLNYHVAAPTSYQC